MRIFVTGATGFAGSHLIDLLLGLNHQVFALVHADSGHYKLPNTEAVREVEGDLLDPKSILAAIELAKPDYVFHLAGQASPRISWTNPQGTFAVNTLGVVNLLEAVVAFGRPPTVIVTSAEMYGSIEPQELPITEKTCPNPSNPYGISKLAAARLVKAYWRHYKLPVIEARPFNHIGPRQNTGFVVPDFASQIAKIRKGNQKSEILVGNLDAYRDFTDVRDVVRAYKELAIKGKPGESYLICSGKAVSIRYILTELIQLSGITATIISHPDQRRPSEVKKLIGSYEKINRDIGWSPSISIEKSLADALEDWMEQ